MNRFRLVLLIFLLSGMSWVCAQSNEFLDGLLAEEQATYGRAAWVALAAADRVGPDSAPADALALMRERGWALDREAGDPITLGEYADLLMQAFGMRGGIMYTLLPGPRYAARELAFRRIIQGKAYPNSPVSGERVMRILGRLLDMRGGAL